MPHKSCVIRVIAAGFIMLAASIAAAQDVPAFYRGRTINLTIGGGPGSDDDIYARLIAAHLARHIAGAPSVVASDMPGGGGRVATEYIYSSAAKDGTAIGAVPPETFTTPLWFASDKVAYDPARIIYLGSAASESTNCFVNSDAPVRSLRDAFIGEVTMGALADGGPTRDGPVLLNALLGTKFRIVATYASISEILAAIQKGDVAGACGLTWSSISTRHPEWLPKGVLRGLVQESVTGSPLADRLGMPLAVNFVGSAADGEVFALAYAQQTFGRPFIMPPGTPPERTALLRKALIDTLQDGELLADAKRASIQINALSGEQVEALLAKLYAAPPQVVERVRAALASRPAR